MINRRPFSSDAGRKRRTAVMAVTAAVAAAVVAVTVGAWKASSRDGASLDVHQVGTSPEDVRTVWTPERLRDARQGDPMPIITK